MKMTTEDDFQKAIDESPEDWQTRLVFADWLQDRGDPRAAGYRAIAILQRRPLQGHKSQKEGSGKTAQVKSVDTWWWHCPSSDANLNGYNHIPRDWFDLLPEGVGSKSFWPVHTDVKGLMSRRGCEDALAMAFSKLPAARQAELLTPPEQPAKTEPTSEKPKKDKKPTTGDQPKKPKKK
jgi:uncharacterized protein (TIGR02996 family)